MCYMWKIDKYLCRPANFIFCRSSQIYNQKNQDPYRVVDNAMVYRKFCSGIFTIGGMAIWEGGQVEIFFKSAILG